MHFRFQFIKKPRTKNPGFKIFEKTRFVNPFPSDKLIYESNDASIIPINHNSKLCTIAINSTLYILKRKVPNAEKPIRDFWPVYKLKKLRGISNQEVQNKQI